MSDIPFVSPAANHPKTEGYLDSVLKNKHLQTRMGLEFPYPSDSSSGLVERLEKLEARVQELEKKNSMAAWHLSQFCIVNMPSLRAQLELRADFVPSHIAAALRHLSDGVEPKPAEVQKVIRRK